MIYSNVGFGKNQLKWENREHSCQNPIDLTI